MNRSIAWTRLAALVLSAALLVSSGCISIISSDDRSGSSSAMPQEARRFPVEPMGGAIDPAIWTDGEGMDRRRPAAIDSQTYVRLSAKVNPTVASIFTTQRVRAGIGDPLGLFRVPFKDFIARSLGSGFVVHEDGFVITNAHVVADADEVRVLLAEREQVYDARLIGIDTLTDLAVLKIEPESPLPVLPLAPRGDVAVGDVAVAIGNPYGLEHSLTIGVISAKERKISRASIKAGQENYLQTSAQINPGNSGGPLLNLAGEAVGVNTAMYAGAQGIGFAIPSDIVRELLPTLVRDGRVKRSFVGLLFTQDPGAGIDGPARGVKVYGVYRGSPAAMAGMQRGDRVITINGKPAGDPFEASRRIADLPVGSRVTVTFERGGQASTVTMTTVEL